MTAPTDFPDDENGAVLRAMAEAGVDLTVEREVEFLHLAPDESAAEALSTKARALGYEVEALPPDEESLEEGDTDWDVICTRRMVPTHADLTRCELELKAAANALGCREDGWGFAED